jgi:hypothetical protein
MSWRRILSVKGLVPLVVVLLLAPAAWAGDRVHSSARPAPRPQPTAAPLARAASATLVTSATVSVSVPPEPAETLVDLRGPDGQVRRFPVEGGLATIQYRQVVLRPGETLVIRWTPAR